jgi:hypothetical protein
MEMGAGHEGLSVDLHAVKRPPYSNPSGNIPEGAEDRTPSDHLRKEKPPEPGQSRGWPSHD